MVNHWWFIMAVESVLNASLSVPFTAQDGEIIIDIPFT